ncbi:acyl-ACP--UDP-N-acetylglucosamine O-acyltransferase [Acidobacteriota bacterium]
MNSEETTIHPSAVIHKDSELDIGVEIGPFCLIGPKVRIRRGTRIKSHVVLQGSLDLGEDCRIHPFSTIGVEPQDLKYDGEETSLRIGDRNIIREYVNISRGTTGGGGITSIGHDNLIMAYSHIAHDCLIGDCTIFANASTLAGHVQVENHANIGAFTGIHQFCRIGKYAYIGGYSVITKDALPFIITVGNRAKAYSVNIVGLRRKKFSKERIGTIKKAMRILLQSKLNTSQALERLRRDFSVQPEDITYLIEFIDSSRRGVIKR